MKKNELPVYDLEERLLDFGAAIITLTRKLCSDYTARHVGSQLLRSGTSPLSNHGEAQAAESTVAHLLNETDQLIRIFVTSIATAEKRRK
jgi:hypothetical protein